MGHSDEKASHSFVQLNLHTAVAWINEDMRKYDILDEEAEYEEIEDDSQESTGYSVLNGNDGLVHVNQVIDYVDKDDELSSMSFYKYFSSVYKTTLTSEEKKKTFKARLPSYQKKRI